MSSCENPLLTAPRRPLPSRIAITGAGVVWEAVRRLRQRRAPEGIGLDVGILVMVFSVAASWFISDRIRKAGETTGSSALAADALHFRTDVWSGTGILFSLLLYRFTGWRWLDPGIALAVGFYIFAAALPILGAAVQDLLDRGLPQETVDTIVRIIEEHRPMVVEWHDLRTRRSGSEKHVDFHVVVCREHSLEDDARRIDHIRRIPFPEPIPGLPTLYREYDPDAILAAARALLDQLAPFVGNCEGLVMCSQMHGLVFCTERGEARSNLTTWIDQRVLMPHPSGRGTYFDVLMQHITPQEFRQLGNELRPGLPVGLLFWLAEQGQLPREDWFAASLPDFVLAHLGRAEPSIDTTNAMAHGVLNLETLDWHRTVMTKLGLDRVRWPRLRPHGEQVALVKMGSRRAICKRRSALSYSATIFNQGHNRLVRQ